MSVELRHTPEGWFIFYGDKHHGPFEFLEDIDHEALSQKLGITPKEVWLAKVRVYTKLAKPKPKPEVLEDTELDWSGGVDKEHDFVYEPLGNGKYVWRLGEAKGISEVEVEREEEKKGKETVRYGIRIGEQLFYFKEASRKMCDPFFETLPFRVPSLNVVEMWVRGEVESPPVSIIFPEVEKYIKIVLDLEEKFETKIDAVWVFHAWLRRISDWAGNLDVGGPFGSGKTTLILALAELTYHAISGTTSPACMSRMNEKYNCTWVIDEYDKSRKIEENLLDMMIRQGDRKGLPVWRYNKDTGTEESFDPFGPKLISYHTFLETALKQRSIYHVKMTKSPDYRLPIINMVRNQFSQRLFDWLFLWYMDSITKTLPILPVLPDFPEDMSALNHAFKDVDMKKTTPLTPEKTGNTGNAGNVLAIRQILYNEITKDLTEDERSVLEKLEARGAELGFIVIRVAKAIGLSDYVEDLKEAFEIKSLEEEEPEYDVEQIVKQILIDRINARDEGALHSDVYKEAVKKAKDEWGQELSPQKFGRVLRDLGFREKKTIKRKFGGARWLLFDNTIKEKLMLGISEEKKSEGEQKKLFEKVEKIMAVKQLSPPLKDICAFCGKVSVLYYQVENYKGEWGLACQDCGTAIQEGLQKRDKA